MNFLFQIIYATKTKKASFFKEKKLNTYLTLYFAIS